MSLPLNAMVIDRAVCLVKDGWTSHTLARNAKGEAVSPLFHDAVRFCAQGAMLRAAHELGLDISEYFRGDAFFASLVELNDSLGKDAVIAKMSNHAKALR
jgi:hypothetical protein